MNVADILTVTGRHAQAVPLLRGVIKNYPTYTQPHQLLVQNLIKLNQNDVAVKALKFALKNIPTGERGTFHAVLAELYMKRNEAFLAKRQFAKALSYAKAEEKPVIYVKLAKSQAAAGSNADAERSYTAALKAKPDSDAAAYGLSKVYMADGNAKKLVELLDDYSDRFPDRTWASVAFAKLALRADNIDAANSKLKKSFEAGVRDVELLRMLSDTYAKLGENEKAQAAGSLAASTQAKSGRPAVVAVEELPAVRVEKTKRVPSSVTTVTAAVPVSPVASTRTTKLRASESLMQLSYRVYGTHQKWRELIKLNPDRIKDANRVEPGTEIRY